MTLATGAHNCVGQHLARREISIVLQAFIERFRNIRPAARGEASWSTQEVWAVTRPPLQWDLR